MDFSESPEHTLMRETLREIGSRYGHAYYLEKSMVKIGRAHV